MSLHHFVKLILIWCHGKWLYVKLKLYKRKYEIQQVHKVVMQVCQKPFKKFKAYNCLTVLRKLALFEHFETVILI